MPFDNSVSTLHPLDIFYLTLHINKSLINVLYHKTVTGLVDNVEQNQQAQHLQGGVVASKFFNFLRNNIY